MNFNSVGVAAIMITGSVVNKKHWETPSHCFHNSHKGSVIVQVHKWSLDQSIAMKIAVIYKVIIMLLARIQHIQPLTLNRNIN